MVPNLRSLILSLAAVGSLTVAAPSLAQLESKPTQPATAPETKPAETTPAEQPAQKAPEKPASEPAEAPARKTPEPKPAEPVSANILTHKATPIDGESEKPLAEYRGKVLLIINTASRCGFTKQYAGLEELYKSKKDQGFEILAFPSNDFRNQEPATNEEIKAFCEEKYKVSFPLFAKIHVIGKDAHPLFKQLAAIAPPAGGEPDWNFTKYLVDRDGNVVQRYAKHVKPQDEELVKRVDELLKTKASAK